MEQKIRKILIKHFALKVYPKNADSYIRRGILKAELEDYHEAIEDFTKAIEIDSKNAAAYRFRSDSKIKLQDFKGAKLDDKMVTEIDPEFSAYEAIKKYQ